MRLLIVVTLLILLSYSECTTTNDTIESLKAGVWPFINAGNKFFNIIRGEVKPPSIEVLNFKNVTFSMNFVLQNAKNYVTYIVLFVVGVIFAIFFPIVGFIFCLCRLGNKCGAKTKAMDPKQARCKRIIYGVILLILVTAMLFGVVFSLVSSILFHKNLSNTDEGVGLFHQIRTDSKNINQSLETIKQDIQKLKSANMDDQQQKKLKDEIQILIDNFYNALKISTEIQQVEKLFEKMLTDTDFNSFEQRRDFLKSLKDKIPTVTRELSYVRSSISTKLKSCNSTECQKILQYNENLHLNKINETEIKGMIYILEVLSSTDFKNNFEKVKHILTNSSIDMKLYLDDIVKKFIKDIKKPSFKNDIVVSATNLVDQIIESQNRLFSFLNGQTQFDRKNTATIEQIESYRYYTILALCGLLFLMLLFYYLGLLFGFCGKRNDGESGCCNRGVGATFLLIGITFLFMLSSLVMVVVLIHMLTVGVVQTDICHYTDPNVENGAQVLDDYFKIAYFVTYNKKAPGNAMNSLLVQCKDKNSFGAFKEILNPYITRPFENEFQKMNDEISKFIDSQLNISTVQIFDNFTTIADPSKSIRLSLSTVKLKDFQNSLKKFNGFDSEVKIIESIEEKVQNYSNNVLTIYHSLSALASKYNKWLMAVNKILNGKAQIIDPLKNQLCGGMQISIRQILDDVLNKMFLDVKCSNLRLNTLRLFSTICQSGADPLNGSWYGFGFYLLFSILVLIFACLLVDLYRRIQKRYPDKEEPDYDNYIGFYARADGNSFKNSNVPKKAAHHGYHPIPMHSVK